MITSKPFKTVNSIGLRQIPFLVRTIVRWVFHHCLVSTLELFSLTQTLTGSRPGQVENLEDHYNSDTRPIAYTVTLHVLQYSIMDSPIFCNKRPIYQNKTIFMILFLHLLYFLHTYFQSDFNYCPPYF